MQHEIIMDREDWSGESRWRYSVVDVRQIDCSSAPGVTRRRRFILSSDSDLHNCDELPGTTLSDLSTLFLLSNQKSLK